MRFDGKIILFLMLVLVQPFTFHFWSSGLYNPPGCSTYKAFGFVFRCSFVLGCRVAVSVGIGVLGYSSSSLIPGTCDSQACCCCGDLKMGV